MSPDGRFFAYASTRSGHMEIWVSTVDGSQSNQVTRMNGPRNGAPCWSPDGRKIAFDSNRGTQSDIFMINADGGTPIQLTSDPATDCMNSWSADGKWIWFVSNRTGSFEVWRVPASGGREVQVTRRGGFGSFESPDGRYFYYSTAYSRGELRRVPVNGGEEETLAPAVRECHDLRVTRSGVYFLAPCAECDRLREPVVLRRYRFADGRIEDVARFRLRVRMGFAVAPDDTFVIVNALRDAPNANLMIVEGLR